MGKRIAVGASREARRAKMLQQAATFLYSLNEQSDRLARQTGRTRGDLAEAQYDFARDLADTITEELKHGSKSAEDEPSEIELYSSNCMTREEMKHQRSMRKRNARR